MRTVILAVLILLSQTFQIHGQNFKTVKINNKVWMAENLSVEVKGSRIYNEDEEFAQNYGRLYTWEVAKNACPSGWHLPTIDEWSDLIEYAGGEDLAGKALKAGGNLGFNASFGGFVSTTNYMLMENYGCYWSSSNYDDNHAWYVFITPKNNIVTKTFFTKSYGVSVRCVKN
jgi:uncharacterized protein (TIGR02145 family)